MHDVTWIDDEDSLESMLKSPSGALMLDTEFIRERTYHPRLCLVQVRLENRIALIDPLAEIDLEPLWQAIDEREIVMHAARQDLEILRLATGRLPARVFDTQIAAALAGFPAQIGYGSLVTELLGVDLPKAHTRTDWSVRPLPRGPLAYAADDVRYLPALVELLTGRLVESGRLDWAREDSARLLDPSLYDARPDDAWQRVKGLGRLSSLGQQRARAIAAWRESTAIERNLPRQWIIRDAELLAVAAGEFATPTDLGEALESRAARRRHAKRLFAVVADVADGPALVERRTKPDPEVRALVKALAGIVAAVAGELGIEPEVIAPQKELRSAAAGETGLRVFEGWRNALVGAALRERIADDQPTAFRSRA